MNVTVGTFNLNNLFTRWNFQAVVPAGTTLTEVVQFTAGDEVRFRVFKGALVNGKPDAMIAKVRDRTLAMNLDVLAVQEVENIEALRTFNAEHLGGLFREAVLVEGNDVRLIDVGVLSKLPIQRIVSHQTEPDPLHVGKRVFGRDLLQIDVMSPNRGRRLFTLFNTHLKSNFVDFREPDPAAAVVANNELRRRQAHAMAQIIARETRPNSRYVVVGDMNDDPDSVFMSPFVDSDLDVSDGLVGVTETRASKPETIGPQPDARWTSRYKQPGQDPQHRLFDQIWVSPHLAPNVAHPMIDRRRTHGGDGSDHDPAWITLTGL